MILVSNDQQGLRTMGKWVPGGDWNLPDEFETPGKFMLTSDKAQFILEQGAYAGYGQLPLSHSARVPFGVGRRRAMGRRAESPLPGGWVEGRRAPQAGGTRTVVHRAKGRRRGYDGIVHQGLPPVLHGYGQMDPMGWHKYRLMQGRSLKAMGYRGYGTTWDQFANRLTVPE